MAHLFISHSTRDGAQHAVALARALEALGHRCWIAPRDVKPAVPYPGQIVAAIEEGAGLVLLVTPGANESPDVLQEVQLASTARKPIAPVIVSATAPAPDLRYYIGVRHQIVWAEAGPTAQALMATFVAPALAADNAKPDQQAPTPSVSVGHDDQRTDSAKTGRRPRLRPISKPRPDTVAEAATLAYLQRLLGQRSTD